MVTQRGTGTGYGGEGTGYWVRGTFRSFRRRSVAHGSSGELNSGGPNDSTEGRSRKTTERFEFPFEENYVEVGGVRLHYVDEGAGPPILMFHGQPTWSYLYRKMIPPRVAAGYRCVAPDLMGFGPSDKPTDESEYTLPRHVELMTGLIEELKLEGVIIVGQD